MNTPILSNFTHDVFGEIRITDVDGTVWFVANDIAKSLGYEKPNNAINTHCRKVNKFNYPVTGRELNIIPESDVYRLIMRSELPEAEKFQDWITEEVLPSIRKTGGYRVDRMNSPSSEFDMVCIGLKYTSEMLKLSDASKLAMMSHAFDTYGLNSKALPQYVENVRPIFSATKLLVNRGKPFSASVFNAKMILAGFMEEKERIGSKGTVKTFKILTDKAVGHYGQNDVNPNNPLETQPHYYEDTFDSLLSII